MYSQITWKAAKEKRMKMCHSSARDACVMSHGKDDNEAVTYFNRLTLLVFILFDYISYSFHYFY